MPPRRCRPQVDALDGVDVVKLVRARALSVSLSRASALSVSLSLLLSLALALSMYMRVCPFVDVLAARMRE